MRLRPQSLKLKVALYLTIGLIWAMLVFTLLILGYQREKLLDGAASHVNQVSDMIVRTTRFAMLQNRPDYVDQILDDVSHQGNISKVRIFSKDGRIIHSTFNEEIGTKVDRSAESCFRCHRGDRPLSELPSQDRSRIFTDGQGKRQLASMAVIRNEPSCTAYCHQHSPDQSVLGVVDVVYSLEGIDQTVRSGAQTIVLFATGFILLAAAFVGLLIHRLIYVPLRDLRRGAKRLALGNLDETVPVRSEDEFGQLAESFNAMTVALKQSREELEGWAHTLEQKVLERTEELCVAEHEAFKRDKLASVGLLAAGVAHEINNPLTGILTFSTLIRKKMADGSQDAEDMDLVIGETRRCSTIIRRLLDFARQKPPEKKFGDLNAMVTETVHFFEWPAQKRQISIALELEADLPPIWMDEDQVKQVLVNLMVNAQHAVEEKGGITILTRRAPEPKRPTPDAEAVSMVEMTVADSGCGIAEKDLLRIFDPFFSSKAVGKGTGLGLSVSHGIIKAHGGMIEVESTLGQGSTFRVFLPIERPPGEEEAPRECGV